MKETTRFSVEIAGESQEFQAEYNEATPDHDWSFDDIAEHSEIVSISLVDDSDDHIDCDWMLSNESVIEEIKAAIVEDLQADWEAKQAERDLHNWYNSTRL